LEEIKDSSDSSNSFLLLKLYYLKFWMFIFEKNKPEALKMAEKLKELIVYHKTNSFITFTYFIIINSFLLDLFPNENYFEELIKLGRWYKEISESVQESDKEFLIHYRPLKDIHQWINLHLKSSIPSPFETFNNLAKVLEKDKLLYTNINVSLLSIMYQKCRIKGFCLT